MDIKKIPTMGDGSSEAAEAVTNGEVAEALTDSDEPTAAADAARREQIEKSIRKTFKKDIFSRFTKAIVEYELVQEGDRIAVCISGGKDSMCMAKLFQELKKHDKFPFELVFIVMDPGYNERNRRLIEANAALLGIPLDIFETRIFDAVDTMDKSPCYLCARMRRGYLYRRAQDLGCNKIALGHHFDDVIETVLMGMLYSGQYQSMMPKLRSTNFPGMELIRPMYLVREADIERWRDYNSLTFLRCACHFTEAQEARASGRGEKERDSKRLETKRLIAEMKKTNPFIEANLFKATQNVVLNKVLGYKLHGEKHSFLEDY
jgi:tRNA(Ile)-lysidine synthase TilS/MesJ